VFSCLKTLYLPRGGELFTPLLCTKNQQLSGNVMLVHLEGYQVREEAISLKGLSLYALREDLPALKKGSYYIADLIGLPVIDAVSQKVYGVLSDVSNYGASDIYEVKDQMGHVSRIPAVGEFIQKVDLEKGVFVTPIEGMFS
jgi:16S rRNA processing protein RimM